LAVTTASRQEQHCRYVMPVANESCPPPDRRRCPRVRRPSLTSSADSAMSLMRRFTTHMRGGAPPSRPPAPALDDGERGAPSARFGQLALGLPP
jgi:hypothetical protein